MQLFHVTWATEGRLPFFPTPQLRCRAVRKLVACGQAQLAAYCIVDEHIHAVLWGEPAVVHRRARAITRGLRGLSAIPMDGARIRPVEDRRHAENVFRYLLTQPQRHGLPTHAALWNGSCLPDLVGARCFPEQQLCWREVWPRYTQAHALAAVGLPSQPLAPPSIEQVARLGAHGLVELVAAGFCLTPPLSGRLPERVLARHTACGLAREAGLPLRQVAAAGGFSLRSAQRLAGQPVPPAARRTVLARLALEDRVRLAPLPDTP